LEIGMTFPKARMWVSGLLFLAWLGYLLTLVLISRHEIVLSRPQFLVAGLCVLAEVADDNGVPSREATILEVLWSAGPADTKLKGEKVTVANLADAGPQGYIGPGKYFLPLDRIGPPEIPFFRVTPVPSSPGFVPAFVNVKMFSPGPDPERAARLAQEFLGLDRETAERDMQDAAKGITVMLARNVPREKAVKFLHALVEGEDDKKEHAEVALPGNDIRIYPLTAETKEQVGELIAAQQAGAPAVAKP
jgi:hypothetical protein